MPAHGSDQGTMRMTHPKCGNTVSQATSRRTSLPGRGTTSPPSLIPSLIQLRPGMFSAHRLARTTQVADCLELRRTWPRRLGKRIGEPVPNDLHARVGRVQQLWTAIRICPVTVTKSMSWPSQRVIGFAGYRAARSAPAEYAPWTAGLNAWGAASRSSESGRLLSTSPCLR